MCSKCADTFSLHFFNANWFVVFLRALCGFPACCLEYWNFYFVCIVYHKFQSIVKSNQIDISKKRNSIHFAPALPHSNIQINCRRLHFIDCQWKMIRRENRKSFRLYFVDFGGEQRWTHFTSRRVNFSCRPKTKPYALPFLFIFANSSCSRLRNRFSFLALRFRPHRKMNI